MQIPSGATIAIVDGEKLKLFRNTGHETGLKLSPVEAGPVEADNHGSGARHQSSAANHDHGQLEEDAHTAGVAKLLNDAVTAGQIKHLVVVASPRALGELRKHLGKQVSAVLVGEIAKDLTGHAVADIEKAVQAA